MRDGKSEFLTVCLSSRMNIVTSIVNGPFGPAIERRLEDIMCTVH